MPRIDVLVRIRPSTNCIIKHDSSTVSIGVKTYKFSQVYSRIQQNELFDRNVKGYCNRVMKIEESDEDRAVNDSSNPHNCTVIGYGQTGSGKTFTIGASVYSKDGLIQQSLEYIFKNRNTLKVSISFMEIYNEQVYDLTNMTRRKLNIIPMRTGCINNGIEVVGLNEAEVNSFEEAVLLLKRGSLQRATSNNSINSESSRSHAIFTIKIEQNIGDMDGNSDTNNYTSRFVNTITFVDLAGSERLKRTMYSNISESIHINANLLALGNVISALYKKSKYIPFRDSKLTRILQNVLNGHVLLIACISGRQIDLSESINTLNYASKAAKIMLECRPIVITDNGDNILKRQILQLKREITKLKDENLELKRRLNSRLDERDITDSEIVQRLRKKIQDYEIYFIQNNKSEASANQLCDKCKQSYKMDNVDGNNSSVLELNAISKMRLGVKRQLNCYKDSCVLANRFQNPETQRNTIYNRSIPIINSEDNVNQNRTNTDVKKRRKKVTFNINDEQE